MGKQYLFRKNTQDLSHIQEFELRIMNLEAILMDMKQELEEMRQQVSEEDLEKIEQMQKYQQAIDQHFKFKAAI